MNISIVYYRDIIIHNSDIEEKAAGVCYFLKCSLILFIRFRGALPEKPWKGIRLAVREGSTCPHRNILLDTFKGDEDCLFLNVYTPELPNRTRHPQLPVMVWIHGGGFAFGSGNSFLYGPDYLVAEGVVLVTINYRLGPLGFLSVGGYASGNAGLKV